MDKREGPAPLGHLKTTVVGSYSAPGWLIHIRESAKRGEPIGAHDLQEAARDATKVAIMDQVALGLDEIGTGEIYHPGGFVGQYFAKQGFKVRAPDRTYGPFGYDQNPTVLVDRRLDPEAGLGAVETWRYARSLTDKPMKATVAGPITLSFRTEVQGGYKNREDLLMDMADLVNAEFRALVSEGATHIQMDEPLAAREDMDLFVEVANRALDGIQATRSLHVCFGDAHGRPFYRRRYDPMFPKIGKIPVDELVLEYANREMAEAHRWDEWVQRIGRPLYLAAGVVDVKSSYLETPEDVAWRAGEMLKTVPADHLALTTDCGFSQTPRWQTLRKIQALVEGARLVRGEPMVSSQS